jgi:hypothetical protein
MAADPVPLPDLPEPLRSEQPEPEAAAETAPPAPEQAGEEAKP